jgi:ribonuclease HI
MKLVVYTDGACTNNGKKGARAAFAYYFPEHPSESHADRVPDDQPQTNNRGELLAILSAIDKSVSSFKADEVDIFVYTDSDYSKNCITKWIPGWIKKGWKTAEGKPVANRDLIEQISGRLMLFQSHSINWVKAHTGGDDEHSRYNGVVDRMAVEVLEGKKEVVITPKNKDITGSPLQLIGPPVSETELVTWCMANLDKLDKDALHTAVIQAYGKTCKKNGTELVKQKLHRSTLYRLISSSHIIVDNNKEE